MNVAPPLWRHIRDSLERALAAGEYPPGTPLPSEAKLAARFGVAIGTVRRAVDELVAARALVRRQGKGTFVPDLDAGAGGAPDGPDRTRFYFFHVQRQDGHREHPQTELLEFERDISCPPPIAAAMDLPPGAPMLRALNLQRLSDTPVMLDELWLPVALFPSLDREMFGAREGTVYGLYQRVFGLSVVRTEERLRASVAEPAVAGALDLPVGAPVLRIERVAHAIGDRPIEYRLSHLDTRTHEYFNSLA